MYSTFYLQMKMLSLRHYITSVKIPRYRLIYFNLKGRAETARMLFKVAEVDFEDFRIEQKRWSEFKHMAPQGLLPVLEFNGGKLPQSGAINRYLARELGEGFVNVLKCTDNGFYGSSNWESSMIDAVIQTVEDCTHDLDIWWMLKDLDIRNKLQRHHEDRLIPRALQRLNQILEDNGGGDGYFVGEKLSLADIHAFNYINDYLPFLHDIKAGDRFPKLGEHSIRISQVPQIKDWMDTRPNTRL